MLAFLFCTKMSNLVLIVSSSVCWDGFIPDPRWGAASVGCCDIAITFQLLKLYGNVWPAGLCPARTWNTARQTGSCWGLVPSRGLRRIGTLYIIMHLSR